MSKTNRSIEGMSMDAGARSFCWIGLASLVAGCYPATFRGPGDGAVNSDATSDGTVPQDAMSDGTSPQDVMGDVPPPQDVVPTGNCMAPVMCGVNVCPSGRCSTGSPSTCDPLGDGVDPDSTTFSRGTLVTTTTGLNLAPNADAVLAVTDSSMFHPGREALLYVVTGPGSGTFTTVVVHCIASATQIFVISPVAFSVPAASQMQLVPVLHFANYGTPTMMNAVNASIDPALPSLGGIVAMRVQGQLGATIRATGYLGGAAPTASGAGVDGRSSGVGSAQATSGHGGVVCSGGACGNGSSGGGGANITAGQAASMASACGMGPAAGGTASSMTTRFIVPFGTGGGSGAFSAGAPGRGGAGGGAVFVAAQSFFGSIDVSGEAGTAAASSSGGGGGGGGTIVMVIPEPLGGPASFDARGGAGSTGNCEGTGGNGGDGVVRVYCTTSGGMPCGNSGNMVPGAMPMTTTHDLSQSPF